MAEARHQSKAKLLDAAIDVVRTKGYNATRVDDICEAAGVTKGSFFHHFDSKDDLAIAAAARWQETARALFEGADFNARTDPLARLLGYLDFRKTLLVGEVPEFTCYGGTIVQEVYATHPELREACGSGIAQNTTWLAEMIGDAMRKHRVKRGWTPASLAFHIQATLQGAFIIAKMQGNAIAVADCIDHLKRYIETLFDTSRSPSA